MPNIIYNYHYTYLITNTTNQMKYIGVRSCNCLPENDDDYMGSSKLLDEVMNETPEYFTKTIIDTFSTREDANDDEQRLHEMYDVARNPLFYNQVNAPTGFCMSGRTHSVETRKKISKSLSGEKNHFYGKHHSAETCEKIREANSGEKCYMYGKVPWNKGIPRSAETKKKLSIAMSGENHPLYGKHRSDETRAKIKEANSGEKHYNYGKSLSSEHKNKISEAGMRRKHSAESRKKISESNMGKTHSDETKKKIGEAGMGRKHSAETRAKMSKSQQGKRKPHERITCPHCNKTGGNSNMKRWHFTNCKEISTIF